MSIADRRTTLRGIGVVHRTWTGTAAEWSQAFVHDGPIDAAVAPVAAEILEQALQRNMQGCRSGRPTSRSARVDRTLPGDAVRIEADEVVLLRRADRRGTHHELVSGPAPSGARRGIVTAPRALAAGIRAASVTGAGDDRTAARLAARLDNHAVWLEGSGATSRDERSPPTPACSSLGRGLAPDA